jgi:hypothetical protein
MAPGHQFARYSPGHTQQITMPAGRVTVLLVVPFAAEREMFADYLRTVAIHVIATDSIEAARREVAQESAPDVVVLRGCRDSRLLTASYSPARCDSCTSHGTHRSFC